MMAMGLGNCVGNGRWEEEMGRRAGCDVGGGGRGGGGVRRAKHKAITPPTPPTPLPPFFPPSSCLPSSTAPSPIPSHRCLSRPSRPSRSSRSSSSTSPSPLMSSLLPPHCPPYHQYFPHRLTHNSIPAPPSHPMQTILVNHMSLHTALYAWQYIHTIAQKWKWKKVT